jgi:hypothetical protein
MVEPYIFVLCQSVLSDWNVMNSGELWAELDPNLWGSNPGCMTMDANVEEYE